MSKGKKASLGCLFWIALILLVIVVFLYNQENVASFIAMIYSPKAEEQAPKPVVTREPVAPANTVPADNQDEPSVTVSVRDNENHEKQEPAATPAPTPTPEPAAETEAPIDPHGSYRNSNIYFVDARNAEKMVLKSVSRKVNFKDTPLTETLNFLLKGPTTTEVKESLTSLIPKGTKIRGLSVKGDVAYINLNDEFRFNNYGLPGLETQLKQLVFTTTEFSNIKRVQILINGKRVNYLAQEGIYVGEPISRSSF